MNCCVVVQARGKELDYSRKSVSHSERREHRLVR